jgi:hypothetical protein
MPTVAKVLATELPDAAAAQTRHQMEDSTFQGLLRSVIQAMPIVKKLKSMPTGRIA